MVILGSRSSHTGLKYSLNTHDMRRVIDTSLLANSMLHHQTRWFVSVTMDAVIGHTRDGPSAIALTHGGLSGCSLLSVDEVHGRPFSHMMEEHTRLLTPERFHYGNTLCFPSLRGSISEFLSCLDGFQPLRCLINS